MFSVADELWISGLPDEQRAMVERYVRSQQTTRFCPDCGGEDEIPVRPANRNEVLFAYQQGFRAGQSAPDSPVPSKLPASLDSEKAAA